MKKRLTKSLAVILSAVMLFSVFSAVGFSAEDVQYGPYDYEDYVLPDGQSELVKSASMGGIQKMFYNALNKLAAVLLKGICAIYPNPEDWKDVKEYNNPDFLPGRENYQTEVGENNKWRLGYASETIVPDDFEPGKYYIGRDLTNRLAKGINDDNRVRVIALDDNSGEGVVIFAAVDALGITHTDTNIVRAKVAEWAAQNGIKIASLNLSATHSHSALDAQGVATESIYKILTGSFKNFVKSSAKDPKLENAEKFKEFYVNVAAEAVKEAILDMKDGDLYYAKVDGSDFIKDKRGLIAKEDIPAIASFKFVPADGSNGVYFADIGCHPTSFGAGAGLLSSDYIYYMEQRIKQQTGYNFLFLQGASGQLGRMNVGIDSEKLPEDEQLGASTRYMGKVFADLLLDADDGSMEKLQPILNAKFKEFRFDSPENYILVLAVKAKLVNDEIYTTGNGADDICLFLEEGYVELGGRVGLGVFPVELYPEVFYGSDIIGDVSWDGTEWTLGTPAEMGPEGVDMYAVPLCNDSLGYCVLDNYYAFFGHIIGDNIADETLSLGKSTASKVVKEFKELMDSIG